MYIDCRRGPVALRVYEDGVYAVTERGAVAIRNAPSLQHHIAALCRHFLCPGLACIDERSCVPVLDGESSGAVAVVTCGGRVPLEDQPELHSVILAACSRGVSCAYPADAWELD